MAEKKTSPWIWIGCGCVLAIAAIVAVILGGFYFVTRSVQSFTETMSDPEKRAERVAEILSSDELPSGYRPFLGASIPLIGEVAVISDADPGNVNGPEDLGVHGFAYLQLSGLLGRAKKPEVRNFVEGRGARPDLQIQSGIRIDTSEVLERGETELEGGKLVYAVHRGTLENGVPGIANTMLLECPDGSSGFGIWWGPDPTAGGDPDDLTLAGTPADLSAVRQFLSHFDLCPGAP